MKLPAGIGTRNHLIVDSLLTLVTVCALASAVACGRETPPGPQATLVVPVENDIQTLDPAQLSDPFTSRIVWQIYEGLVGLDEDGKPTPLIAESWVSSADHKEWTFTLRANVQFHESDCFGPGKATRAVIAEDVRYSYLRFAKGFGSFVFSSLVAGFEDYVTGRNPSVSGFVVLDDRHFQVRLKRSDPAFIYRITSPYLSIMPREAVEKNPNAFGQTVAVGTGPFRLRSRRDTEVILEPNSKYWRSTRGNLQQVIFRVEKNDQLRVARFEQGEYGLIVLPTTSQARFLSAGVLLPAWSSKARVYKSRTFNVHDLGADNRRVRDLHLRRAIAMAINKEAIVSGLLGGSARLANELTPPGLQGFYAPPPLAFDPRSAKQEIAASRYRGEALTLLVSDAPNHDVVGQFIQSQLKDVGVRVELQRVDLNSFVSRLFSSNRPDLFMGFSEWVFSAPELVLESYHSKRFPNPNVFGYSNARVDGLIARALTGTDRASVNVLCGEVSGLVASEAPGVPLFHLDGVFLLHRKYSGFAVNGHQQWNIADMRSEGN